MDFTTHGCVEFGSEFARFCAQAVLMDTLDHILFELIQPNSEINNMFHTLFRFYHSQSSGGVLCQ